MNLRKRTQPPKEEESSQPVSIRGAHYYFLKRIRAAEKEEEESCQPKSPRFGPPKIVRNKGNNTTRILSTLNVEQLDFVGQVYEELTSERPFYYFLSGGAGSGKSHVVQAISSLCTEWFCDEDERVSGVCKKLTICDSHVLVVAPTEYTASLINGKTLHGALAIPHSKIHGPLPKLSKDFAERLNENLKNIKLIIIDEISSVGSDLFSHINTRLQQIFHSDDIFANKSIIVVGDLRQISPESDRKVYKAVDLWSRFQFYELTTAMRQMDEKFSSVLNNLRKGEVSDEDLKLLNSRNVLSKNFMKHCSTPPLDSIYLCCSEKTAEYYNQLRYKSLSAQYFISNAVDKVSGSNNKEAIAVLEKFHERQPVPNIQGLRSKLKLTAYGSYMLSHDIDPSDGLVKGVRGLLVRAQLSCSDSVDILWMQFEKNQIGEKMRASFYNFAREITCMKSQSKYPSKMEALVPICRITVTLQDNLMHNLKVTRTQFPVAPAEALTVNEFRGGTFSNAFVPLIKGENITTEFLYVATSRVKYLSGLFLIGEITADSLIRDKELDEEYARLSRSALVKKIPPLIPNKLDNLTIYFHNVEREKPRVPFTTGCHLIRPSDIFAHPMLKGYDVLILVGYCIEAFYLTYGTYSIEEYCKATPKTINGRHAVVHPNLIIFGVPAFCLRRRNHSVVKSIPLSIYLFRVSISTLLLTGYIYPGTPAYRIRHGLNELLRIIPMRSKIVVIFSHKDIIFGDECPLDESLEFQFHCLKQEFSSKSGENYTTIYTNFQNYNAQTHPFFFPPSCDRSSSHDPVYFHVNQPNIGKPVPEPKKKESGKKKIQRRKQTCPIRKTVRYYQERSVSQESRASFNDVYEGVEILTGQQNENSEEVNLEIKMSDSSVKEPFDQSLKTKPNNLGGSRRKDHHVLLPGGNPSFYLKKKF